MGMGQVDQNRMMPRLVIEMERRSGREPLIWSSETKAWTRQM
jgi:hypothetical protein